jgi:hypothetical protein
LFYTSNLKKLSNMQGLFWCFLVLKIKDKTKSKKSFC